jgi:hypothetical protein
MNPKVLIADDDVEFRFLPGASRELSGAAIYEAIMERFEFSTLRVSTRGLRFAAVME